MNKNKFILLLLLLFGAITGIANPNKGSTPSRSESSRERYAGVSVTQERAQRAPATQNIPVAPSGQYDKILGDAFYSRSSGVQAQGSGTVSRVLPDDNEGSRHQRFLLRLNSGQTLLIAHNIDLAPRIPSLREGDTVSFFGQYEWNDKGGVVHWTHHDPNGRHVAGWLYHNGMTYQ